MAHPNLAFFPNVVSDAEVWNREYAVKRLTSELALARQQPDYSFSILLVYVDGFSTAGRGRLGFASGTDLAPRVFEVLTHGLRKNEVCCHLAADEFLLILPHRSRAECRELAGDMMRAWSPAPGSPAAAIELHIGWASSATPQPTPLTIEGLFAAADESLTRGDGNGSPDAPSAGTSWNDLPRSSPADHGTVAGHS